MRPRLLDPLRLPAMVACTALFAVPAIVVSAFDRGGARSSAIVAAWARWVLRLAGVRVVVEGADRLPPEGGQLYLSCHQSLLDVPALYHALPARTRFVAKKELFRIPLFGWAIRMLGFVPIDRGNRRAARAALETASAWTREQRPIAMFPEGTRSSDGALLPFKQGAFALALRHHLPIVPVACLGGRACLPARSASIRPGTMIVRIGEVVGPADEASADRAELVATVRGAIQALMEPAGQVAYRHAGSRDLRGT